MFRDEDAARIASVLTAKAAGDTDAMVRLAVQLWLAPPLKDGFEEVVSQVLDHLGAAKARAIDALLTAVETGQRPRPTAFALFATALPPDRLVTLAERVIEAEWVAEPYLSTVLDGLVDHGEPKHVEALITKHASKLRANRETWLVIAEILTMTRVGDRQMVDEWFREWDRHERVPMWLLAYYGSSFMPVVKDPWTPLIALAVPVLAKAEPDDTKPFFQTFVAMELLAQHRTDEFRALMVTLQPALEAFLSDFDQSNATINHVKPNGSTPGNIRGDRDIAFTQLDDTTDLSGRAYTLVRHCFRAMGILSNILLMLEAPRRSADAERAAKNMTHSAVYPMLGQLWSRLKKDRLSWFKRFKIHVTS